MSDDKYKPSGVYATVLGESGLRPGGKAVSRLTELSNDDEDFDVQPTERKQTPDHATSKESRTMLDPGPALARTVYEASVTKEDRRRIAQAVGIAIVITVPSAAWVKPISGLIDELTESSRYSRNGSERRDQPTDSIDLVASSLANGNKVIGISQDPKRFLPSLLVGSADLNVVIKPPDAAALVKAMRMSLRGRIPKDIPDDLGAGLDFPELIAALRKNTSPAEAVRRMGEFVAATIVSDDDGEPLPKLEDALFYGPARDWALDLAKDIAAAKKNGNFSSLPRGALFAGGPGTGKTILAKLISRACGVPFVSASMGDLFASSDGYLGGVVKANRALFARAAALSPCVLFIDEIDALPNRATMDGRAKEWWNTLLTDFLVLVASAPKGVIILAATNADPTKDLDSALLRPGRLERVFEIAAPKTAEALESVYRFHLRGALASEDLKPLARLSLGATPAVVMDQVRTATRTARTAGRGMVLSDLVQVVCPPDKRGLKERRLIALHEAAHISVAILLGIETVKSVSVLQVGQSDGRVAFDGLGNPAIDGREDIERVVKALLAGRAAEVVFIGAPGGGAGGVTNSDLDLATSLIAAIHGSLGLADSLLFRSSTDGVSDIMTRDPAFRLIVEEHLHRLAAEAELLVRRHRDDIERVAKLLLERRFLTAAEVRAVLTKIPAQQPALPARTG